MQMKKNRGEAGIFYNIMSCGVDVHIHVSEVDY